MPGKKIGSEKKENAAEIVFDLERGMRETEAMGKRLRAEGGAPSPRRTMQLLEEIKVPALKLLREAHH